MEVRRLDYPRGDQEPRELHPLSVELYPRDRISDARIQADDGTNVTISLWDYRRGEYVLETMPGVEFVRRFLLHIVHGNIHRVRYAGLF